MIMLLTCRLINLPKISDPRGKLSYIEGGVHLPFDIKRVYYLYDVPSGMVRGGHAHKNLHQLIIPISGSFDISLEDARGDKQTFHLNSPDIGLYICPMIWRDISNFSQGAVCMVLASAPYDEGDYIRKYDEFLADTRSNNPSSI